MSEYIEYDLQDLIDICESEGYDLTIDRENQIVTVSFFELKDCVYDDKTVSFSELDKLIEFLENFY
jgi:hypothetical protein